MASTLLYVAILVVTGTVLEETSALTVRDAVEANDVEFWQQGAYSQLRFSLAPSYGKLDSESLKLIDKSLKVMIGGVLNLNLSNDYNWFEIKNTLDKSPFTKRSAKDESNKSDRIRFKSVKVLGIGPSKTKRGYMIRSWFTNLIGNMDILKDTHINLDKIVDVVTKFTVNMWTKLFTVRRMTLNLLDVGILRFPDVSHPFFTLYRINLTGRCVYRTYMFWQRENSDIAGFFCKEVYYPNREYIAKLSKDLTKTLVSEVEDLFS